jgi:hypothetical protein
VKAAKPRAAPAATLFKLATAHIFEDHWTALFHRLQLQSIAMHLQVLVLASTALTSLASATYVDAPQLVHAHSLSSRQINNSEEAYLRSVCTPPNVPNAPCQVINNIESACQPNGTSTLAYLAHQECMCSGGFFSNWFGCLNCLYVHGGRSKAQSIVFSQILTSASNSLCTGTPTVKFADIFASLTNSPPNAPSTAGTGTTDLFPSMTEVSLYYTASGSQGPGAITGSAAQATTPVTASPSGLAGASSVPSSQSVGGAAGVGSLGTATGSSVNSASASAATSKASSSGALATSIVGRWLGVAAVGIAFFTI